MVGDSKYVEEVKVKSWLDPLPSPEACALNEALIIYKLDSAELVGLKIVVIILYLDL